MTTHTQTPPAADDAVSNVGGVYVSYVGALNSAPLGFPITLTTIIGIFLSQSTNTNTMRNL